MNDQPETAPAADALREREEWYRTLFISMLEGLAYCRMLYDDEGQPADWRYLAVKPCIRADNRIEKWKNNIPFMGPRSSE